MISQVCHAVARTWAGRSASGRAGKHFGSTLLLLATLVFAGRATTCSAASAGTLDAVYNFSASDFCVDPTAPYVFATSGSSLQVINSSTLAVERTIALPAASYGMSMSADGSRLYLAGGSSQSVFVVDTSSWGLLPSLSVGYDARDVAMGLNNRLYVLGSRLSQIDATTGASTGPDAPVYPYSGSLRMSPDRRTLYYATFGASPGSLYQLDVSSTTPRVLWQNPTDIGENGEQLALSHDGSMLSYVCGYGYHGYQIPNFRTSDMSLLGVFPTGAYPDCLAYSAGDRYAFALHTLYPTAVDIYDLSTYAMVGQFPVVDRAEVMTTDQSGQHLFVAFDGVYNGHTEVRVYDTGMFVPEPSGACLLAMGLCGVALRRRAILR
jgi:DNA-binding beta-propeller fold protein YncE